MRHHIKGKMEINCHWENEHFVISAIGEALDRHSAELFWEKARRLIDLHAVNVIILDMSKISRIDSVGMGSLLSILRLIEERKGKLKLVALSRSVRVIFELLAMDRVFELYLDLDEAFSVDETREVE